MVATSYTKYSASSLAEWGYDSGTGNDYLPSWDWNTANNTINYKYYTTTDAVTSYKVYTTTDAVTSYKVTLSYDTPTGGWDLPIKFHSSILIDDEYVFLPFTYPYAVRALSKEDMLQAKRNELKSNLIIQIKSRNELSKYPTESEPERKALETLREIVTETEFRKYLRYGFVLVKGQSGKTYQIFKNKSHCKVWLGGKLVEEVCVRIKDKEVPLTDNVIAFKTMIETSEEEFKKLGNVYKMAV